MFQKHLYGGNTVPVTLDTSIINTSYKQRALFENDISLPVNQERSALSAEETSALSNEETFTDILQILDKDLLNDAPHTNNISEMCLNDITGLFVSDSSYDNDVAELIAMYIEPLYSNNLPT